jgi:hypothetical protein
VGLQRQHQSKLVVVRKTNMKHKLLFLGLALGMLVLGANAASPAAPANARLQATCMAADFNHDGFVSLDEFHQDVLQGWRALDSNNSGYIVLAELASVPGMDKGMIDRLKRSDTDGDGKLSFREVVKSRMSYFEAADTNNDDRLSMQECVDRQRKMTGGPDKATK